MSKKQTGNEAEASTEVSYDRPHLTALETLDEIIRSRCPLIFIECPEEPKLVNSLQEFSRLRNKKLILWDCVTGPSCIESPTKHRTSAEEAAALMDPMEMLDFIEQDTDLPGAEANSGAGGGAVYVMLDLHNWLQSSTASASRQMDGTERDIIRKFRSMAESCKKHHKTIVIVSRDRVMPNDLREIAQTILWPLPVYEEIRAELDNLIGLFHIKVSEMSDTLDKNAPQFTSEERDEMARAFCGLSMERIGTIFRVNAARDYMMPPGAHVEEIIAAKKAIIADADCGLTYIDTDALPPIDSIGGLAVLKEYIRTRSKMHGEAARHYGLPNLKGILLIGVQGCGKSMTAKSIGRLWRLPTIRLDVGSIFSSLVGASENRMRRAIQYMEAMSPCVVWLDEIEKSMAGTGSSDRSDAGTAARVFSTMLTWMSDRTAPVYLVATANNPQTLPAEMIRAGRFDERFFIDLPTPIERNEILVAHIRRFGRDTNNFDLELIASDDITENFSGAELEASLIEAMTVGFSEDREFTTEDIVNACQATFPLAETMAEQVQGVRGWAINRCRPASERLDRTDRLRRRQQAAKKLREEATDEKTESGDVSNDVPDGGSPKEVEKTPNSPDLGD